MDQMPEEIQGADPKLFQLNGVEAPLPLQIIAGLMWVGGVVMILVGIPFLLVFGLGIIPIMLGAYNFKYGNEIFKMRKTAYKGTLFLQSIVLELSIILWFLSGIVKVDGNKYSILLAGIPYAFLIIGVVYSYRGKFAAEQEQETSSQKTKSSKIIKTIAILISVIVVAAIINGCVRSLSGAALKEKYPRYDKKIYSIKSDNGKVEGFLATRIVDHAPGEFPSGIFNFDIYFNFIFNDSLNITKGAMTFDDSRKNDGEVLPALCNVDLSKMYLFASWAHAINSPFRCGNVETNATAESYFGTGHKTYLENNLKDVPDAATINIYDADRLIKTYQVKITPTNLTSEYRR